MTRQEAELIEELQELIDEMQAANNRVKKYERQAAILYWIGLAAGAVLLGTIVIRLVTWLGG